jgi:hypothetical protein
MDKPAEQPAARRADGPAEPRGLARALLNVRHGSARVIGRYPRLFFPMIRLFLRLPGQGRGPVAAVSRKTEILIEGFPRSANTFATWAFLFAQERAVEVAHHLHAPAQVIRAVRLGVPSLVIVREATDAILSYLVRYPNVPACQPLKRYVELHERIRPCRRGFVVATFEQVTTDLGAVIRRVNDAFGTSFREFEHTEGNVRKCFELMDEANRQVHGGGRLRKTFVSRPSEDKQAMKARVAARLEAPELANLRTRARELYEEFRSCACPQADPRRPPRPAHD